MMLLIEILSRTYCVKASDMGDTMEFSKESLSSWLESSSRRKELGLSVDYMLECIESKEIQSRWKPKFGDIMVGSTGNIWVISGSHKSIQELGGELFFFGGSLCVRGDGCVMNDVMCYTMNKDGKNWRNASGSRATWKDPYHCSTSEFRWIPRKDQFEELQTASEYFNSIVIDADEYKDVELPKKFKNKYEGKADHDVRGWKPE